jgi:AcrR family transcriptional regulator
MNENGINTKERILQAAEELFFRYGIRSITMDDIARHLSVSKKTLYRYFEDKDQIVATLTKFDIAESERCSAEIAKQSRDPVDEILQSMEYLTRKISGWHPSMIYDLQKYHPKSWGEVRKFSQEYMLNAVVRNLRRGIRQGIYRSNLNILILARLRIEQVSLAMNPEIYPPSQFDLKKVEWELLNHFLHGILTDKGRKLLEMYESSGKSKKQKIVA